MSEADPFRDSALEPGSAPWCARHRVLLFALTLGALAHLAPFVRYLTDDTFIHLQFAKNLIAGEGFSFNAGTPTYGATSPLWVFLLVLVGRFIPGADAAPSESAPLPALAGIAKVWGALCLVGTMFALVRLGRTLGWRPWMALGAGALLAAHAWSARWAISGMETPLAVFLVTVSLMAVASAIESGRGYFVAGLFLGVATLARPECWLLLLLGLCVIGWAAWPVRGRRLASTLTGAAFATIPWFLIAWSWFHRILPNTGAAKAGAALDPGLALTAIRSSIRIVLSTDALPVALAVIALALAGPSLLRRMPRGRRAIWILVAAWPVALALGLAYGGVQIVSRYLLPAVPSILLLGMASLDWAMARWIPRGRAIAALAFFTLYAAQNVTITSRFSAPHALRHTAGLRTSLAAFGLWAKENTPAGTSFAIPDIGAFGFYSDRPVLDLFGLVTPVMAPIAVREGYDAVVFGLLFEKAGRPAYLIDRARDANRLDPEGDPTSPYRFVSARSIPDLGITRPGEYVYSLYKIQWDHYDRLHPRFAEGSP